ncbi:MAG: sigma factor [Eubacterium sp.]
MLYERLLAGEAEVSHRVVESHLQRVVTLATKYKNRGVPLEDLIQEGNLSLLLAVEELCGNSEVLDVKKELDRYVKSRMIELADEQMEVKVWKILSLRRRT